jgi:hypothetical protein
MVYQIIAQQAADLRQRFRPKFCHETAVVTIPRHEKSARSTNWIPNFSEAFFDANLEV